MSKAKKSTATDKKGFRKEVAGTLKEVFTDIQSVVGDKKFDKKIKKASKIIAAGALPKKEKEKTKPAEKAAVKTKSKAGKTKKVSKKTVKEKAPAKKTKKAGKPVADAETTS